MPNRDKPAKLPVTSALSRPHHVRVTEDQAGQRVDNFLIRQCAGVPRSHLYRLIRSGDVRVDGRRVKQTRKLVEGEQVRIPALHREPASEVHVPDRLAAAAGASILLEHEDFLVVNKPTGVAVHGGSGLSFGLIDALRQQRQEPSLELAHRLDRATSGCLLVGRRLKVNRQLQNLFREHRIAKRYSALVDGRWPAQLSRVDAPLMKNVAHAGERRVVVDAAGQHALTHFSVVRSYEEATLLDVELDTGRTHQIRVHARHSGHAIVGDTRYGDNQRNRYFKTLGLSRLFLHARELEFDWGTETIRINAEPDEPWCQALNKLR